MLSLALSVLLLKLSYVFALTVSNINVLDAANATQPLNFTSLISGYCGTSACASFTRPPLTDCNITTCACTDTISKNLATCLQCGYDNSPGMTLSSAQQYLTNFTSACAANGTAVQTETLVVNGARARMNSVNLGLYTALWGSLSVLWVTM